jgi:hypothetical protein
MTVYVFRNGLVVPKGVDRAGDVPPARSHLPAPMLSRMEAFESPVTGAEITSWRDRDRDMAAAGAVDPRDLPKNFKRGRAVQKKEAENARRDQQSIWTDPSPSST